MRIAHRHRTLVRCSLVVAAACALGAAGMHGGPVGAQTVAAAKYPAGTVVRLHQRLVKVTISNYTFVPARLVVSPGTKIVWTNLDGDPHTVTSLKGVFSSVALDTGSHYARVFKQTGTFAYICSIHPFMHGTVIVKK